MILKTIEKGKEREVTLPSKYWSIQHPHISFYLFQNLTNSKLMFLKGRNNRDKTFLKVFIATKFQTLERNVANDIADLGKLNPKLAVGNSRNLPESPEGTGISLEVRWGMLKPEVA